MANPAVVGATIGIVFGLGCGIFMGLNTPADEARTFQRGGKPAVTRIYRPIAPDYIMVGPKEQSISLAAYLVKIPNKYDRDIEEAEIKKLIDW
jgi:hypothetical protein